MNKFWDWFYTTARKKNIDFYVFLIGFAIPFGALYLEQPTWSKVVIGGYVFTIFISNVFYKFTRLKK